MGEPNVWVKIDGKWTHMVPEATVEKQVEELKDYLADKLGIDRVFLD